MLPQYWRSHWRQIFEGNEEYLRGYGEAVSDAWEAWLRKPETLDDLSDDPPPEDVLAFSTDLWEGKSLKGVCELLKVPWDRPIG